MSVPTVIGPRSASLFEVAPLEQEERYHTSVGTRQDVAGVVGNCMAVAIGGQSPRSSLVVANSVVVYLLVQLLRAHAGIVLILLPLLLVLGATSARRSVALVVLLVLLRANLLSSATAVDEGARLHMVPFGHRTCTTCQCSIHDSHKFFLCIVCMCCIRRIVVVHIRDKLVTYLLCPMSPM